MSPSGLVSKKDTTKTRSGNNHRGQIPCSETCVRIRHFFANARQAARYRIEHDKSLLNVTVLKRQSSLLQAGAASQSRSGNPEVQTCRSACPSRRKWTRGIDPVQLRRNTLPYMGPITCKYTILDHGFQGLFNMKFLYHQYHHESRAISF